MSGKSLKTKVKSPKELSSAASKIRKPPAKRPKAKVTRITIRYDVGFPNELFIRGEGGGLSWEKGTPLKNISKDTWVWETRRHFHSLEFKVILNDALFEEGENHSIACGSSTEYSPCFPFESC